MVIELGLTVLFLALFMKYVFESPHFVMTATANMDNLKYILNNIATFNG